MSPRFNPQHLQLKVFKLQEHRSHLDFTKQEIEAELPLSPGEFRNARDFNSISGGHAEHRPGPAYIRQKGSLHPVFHSDHMDIESLPYTESETSAPSRLIRSTLRLVARLQGLIGLSRNTSLNTNFSGSNHILICALHAWQFHVQVLYLYSLLQNDQNTYINACFLP